MAEYEVIEMIGEGSFGKVYRCRKSDTGEIVAMKNIVFHDIEGVPTSVMREIDLLQQMDHPNIVKLLEVRNGENKVSLILEFAEYNLEDFILEDSSTLEPLVIKRLLQDILSGLQYCHANKIIHRDLKLDNLLINSEDRVVKLADFGLARIIDTPPGPLTRKVGNLLHRAPEVLAGSAEYSTPIDIWAVGCTFAEIVTNRDLFLAESDIMMLRKIARIIGTPNEQIWPGVTAYPFYQSLPQVPPRDLAQEVPGLEPAGIDLLSRMLRWNPSDRITAADALEHEYFDDIRAQT